MFLHVFPDKLWVPLTLGCPFSSGLKFHFQLWTEQTILYIKRVWNPLFLFVAVVAELLNPEWTVTEQGSEHSWSNLPSYRVYLCLKWHDCILLMLCFYSTAQACSMKGFWPGSQVFPASPQMLLSLSPHLSSRWSLPYALNNVVRDIPNSLDTITE